MTVFLGIVLLCVIYDVIGSAPNARKWWRFALSILLALVVAGLMMLSYWDWRPV
jgi:hypothetical protein